MPLVETETNAIADTEAARLAFVSLHTADPGTTGTGEAAGGAPAYARQPLAPGAAVGGVVTCAEATFDVPAGNYTHFGTWDSAIGGVFRGGNPLATPQTPSSQGQIKVTISLPVTVS